MIMDNVDLDRLTEAQLRDLNHRIVERLKFLHKMRAHSRMLEFSLGERVTFTHDGHLIRGAILRYNQQTVTVQTDDHGKWKVSPQLLQRDAIEIDTTAANPRTDQSIVSVAVIEE